MFLRHNLKVLNESGRATKVVLHHRLGVAGPMHVGVEQQLPRIRGDFVWEALCKEIEELSLLRVEYRVSIELGCRAD